MTKRSRAWGERDIPDQAGRTVLITGASSGLGLRTATVLAGKGARVLLACRSPERGERALRAVREQATSAEPRLVELDLAELSSVRDAAATVRDLTRDSLHLLINNAGVMGTPRGTTADGFETQFGTNYLGHAALTWLLMPALRGGSGARVVTVSSLSANRARLDLADPNFEHRRYNPAAAYAQSKLANHVFALELDRRLRAAGEDVSSVAAHPGYTTTNLVQGMGRTYRNPLSRAFVTVTGYAAGLGGQPIRTGVLPQLQAATAPDVGPGGYVGPRAFFHLRGRPAPATPPRAALDEALGAGLWDLTAKLTGITPDPA